MPIKIREIVAELTANGFVLTKGGKGSHRRYKHQASGLSATICGKDGDDAKPYLVKQVRTTIGKATGKGE